MRRLFRRLSLLALPLAMGASTPMLGACGGDGDGPAGACCRRCSTGKACGDSCIDRNDTCRSPRGCACNA